MKINEFINESTTAGAIATVATPMTTQSRNASIYGGKKGGNLLTGKKTNKKYANSISESKMKQVASDLETMQDGNFKQKYGKTKEKMMAILGTPSNLKPKFAHEVNEATLEEDDLILVPGQGHKLKSGFIPHDKDRTDHEVEMAKSDLFQAAKNAKQVYELIHDVTEDEGVIVGHDANDPEIAILGGAGTMSLSRLKKKAQGEAEQLANDLARGRFKAAAYNIKQLENTLKTIVAAEDEMSKKYFGENAWNQLGQRKPNTNLPAPERGSRVNHGKRFEEGDIVLPLSGPLKGQPHKVIHSQRTSIRIVPLGRDSYPGDTIAPRTKHEWVIPADMNEDYTGEFAAEKTCETNSYGGQPDIQHRGAISETPTDNPTGTSTEGGWRRTDIDEYREMSPALKAAQQNLIALRNKEKATSVPGKRERAPRDRVELDKPKPASVLTKGAQEVDPDTMDAIAAFLAKGGEIKKGRPGKAPPTGRQQASKHIGGGGKYRKKSDTPGQGANYRGAAIVAVEEEQLDEKCWTGYKQVGMKKKGGKEVPNCVPKESAIMKGLKR